MKIESPSNTAVKRSNHRNGSSRAVMTTVASKFAILFINAATGIITARLLRAEGRGELSAMTLWPLFLSYVTTLGIPSSLIYIIRKNPSVQDEHIANGLLMTSVLGSVAGLLGASILPSWLGHQYGSSIVLHAQIFLIATPLLALTQTGRAVFEAKGLFTHSNWILILYPATTLVGLLLLLVLHRLSPTSAAGAYMFNAVPSFALMAFHMRSFMRRRLRVNVDACRIILSYGIRSYGVDLLGTLALSVDQVLVIRMLSAAQMGGYGVILSLSRMFNLFQASIVTVLFPKAAGRPAAEVLVLVERAARLGTLITGLFCLPISVVGSTVLTILYGKEYAAQSFSLQILLLEVTLSGCVFILAQTFMALGRPGMVTILQGIGLAMSIPLMLLLVPRYGIMGAALSLLVSTIARLVFVFCGFRLFLKLRLPRLVPQLADARMFLQLLKASV